MRRRPRPRVATGVLVLLAGAAGCSDIQNELDAGEMSRPTAAATVAVSPQRPTTGPNAGSLTASTPCPASGAKLSLGRVDAAMGLRAVTVQLTNCGKKPYRVNGYPEVIVLDENRVPLGLIPTRGTVFSAAAKDEGPHPLTLAPGDFAVSVLHWNNRVTATDPVGAGAYVAVAPAEGEERRELPLLLDIGSDGKLGVTAWALPD
jgi:hypothetical protein